MTNQTIKVKVARNAIDVGFDRGTHGLVLVVEGAESALPREVMSAIFKVVDGGLRCDNGCWTIIGVPEEISMEVERLLQDHFKLRSVGIRK